MTIDSEVDEILDVAITQAVLCGLEVDGAFDELTIRKEAYGKITNLIAQEANKARQKLLTELLEQSFYCRDEVLDAEGKVVAVSAIEKYREGL